MASENIAVMNNAAAQRYEVQKDGFLARLEYTQKDDRIAFQHTEVPPELGGQGIGSVLVRTALEDARDQRLTVVPYCPFVRSYIQRHQEFLPLVAPAHRTRLEQAPE